MLDVRVDAARAVIGATIRPATIGISDGRIVRIAEHGADLDATVVIALASDEVLLPGLVDTHVHVNEPGRQEWEGFASATRAAAAGGVTSIVDMPLDCLPVTTSVAALDAKRSVAAGKCWIDVGFWAGLVPDNLDQLAALHDAGALGFKCFLLDSGVVEFAPVDDRSLLAGMTEIARLGAPLLVHAESAEQITPAPHGRSYAGFLASRPDASEQSAIARVIDLVRRTGARTHIVHVSSGASLPLLHAAKAEGLPITAETCPHYLALDAESIPEGATEYACCPPIRSAANAELLWAGLQDGTLDMVVSDHSPAAAELKHRDTGDFGRAWGGISSVQLGLSVVWTAAKQRAISLVDVARWMSTAPATLAGLTDRGAIAVGLKADLCVFAPSQEWVVDPSLLHHRQPLTPYAGSRLTGRVSRTLLAGAPADHGRGQLLSQLGAPCG